MDRENLLVYLDTIESAIRSAAVAIKAEGSDAVVLGQRYTLAMMFFGAVQVLAPNDFNLDGSLRKDGALAKLAQSETVIQSMQSFAELLDEEVGKIAREQTSGDWPETINGGN